MIKISNLYMPELPMRAVCAFIFAIVASVGARAEDIGEADAAFKVLQTTYGVMFSSEQEAQAYAKYQGHQQGMHWEKVKRLFAVRAAEFYDRFPDDPRRLDAMRMYLSYLNDPMFYVGLTPGPAEGEKWTKKEWAAYLRNQEIDSVALKAWIDKGDSMVADVAASPKYTREQKEYAEWQKFGRHFRLASYRFQHEEQVDWRPSFDGFYAHVRKYSDTETLGKRAEDFLNTLKTMEPEMAAAGWRQVMESTSASDVKAGARNLRSTAQHQLDELSLIAEGNILDLVKFTALDGRQVDLAAMKDKVVLLDFWATWCGPCLQELPGLKKLYETYQASGFEIIGISGDEGPKEPLMKFLTDNGCSWPQHFDGKRTANEMARRFNVTAWPTTYLIGKDGKMIAKNIFGSDLESAIRLELGINN